MLVDAAVGRLEVATRPGLRAVASGAARTARTADAMLVAAKG